MAPAQRDCPAGACRVKPRHALNLLLQACSTTWRLMIKDVLVFELFFLGRAGYGLKYAQGHTTTVNSHCTSITYYYSLARWGNLQLDARKGFVASDACIIMNGPFATVHIIISCSLLIDIILLRKLPKNWYQELSVRQRRNISCSLPFLMILKCFPSWNCKFMYSWQNKFNPVQACRTQSLWVCCCLTD